MYTEYVLGESRQSYTEGDAGRGSGRSVVCMYWF